MLNKLTFVTLTILLLKTIPCCSTLLRIQTQQCMLNNSTTIAQHGKEYFVDTESKFMEGTTNYFFHLRSFLRVLKRYRFEVSGIAKHIENKDQYLENAMNLFSLLKRADKVWKIIVKIVSELPGRFNPTRALLQHDQFAEAKLYLDKHASLSSGYRGLSRLQTVYNLTSEALANGGLEGASSHATMSAEDCHEFASFYYKRANYERCIEWVEEAMKKIGNDGTSIASKQHILEKYFVAKCIKGDVFNASQVFRALMTEHPSFTPSPQLLDIYNKIMKHGCRHVTTVMEEEERIRSLSVERIYWDLFLFDDKEDAEEVDYGEYSVDELCNRRNVHKNVSRYLTCRYVTYNKPELMIGPLKVEEFNIDPPVLLFHQVMSDKEIKLWTDYAKPRMRKSPSLRRDGQQEYDTNSRTSLDMYMYGEDFPPDRVLDERSRVVTGCSEHWAFPNQITAYGLAGEFRPHVDYLVKRVNDTYFADYSILMYYLNDVEKGGHTVFPFLQVSVAPVRGSALMWFHRKPDGKPDVRSMHAGCPVLQGVKWIVKKRYHVKSQDFPKCTEDGNSSYQYYYL